MTTLPPATIWLAIALAAMGTYLIRLSFLGLISDATRVPLTLQTALSMVPAAVMAALVAPALLRSQGSLAISLDNLRLIAGVVAAVAAWRFKNMLVTIAVGMSILWVLEALG